MFVAVGVLGALLLVVFLVFDDFLDEIIPDADWISGPVIGAFLAAFGLFGWMVQSSTDAAAWVAALVGLGGGVGLGYGTYRLTKALANTPTDATPTQRDLLGRPGRVITAISAGRAPFLPADEPAVHRALAAFELEKAAYEVVYEANNRPAWIAIPLRGVVTSSAALRHPPSAGAA